MESPEDHTPRNEKEIIISVVPADIHRPDEAARVASRNNNAFTVEFAVPHCRQYRASSSRPPTLQTVAISDDN
jgi:hypothetical protein